MQKTGLIGPRHLAGAVAIILTCSVLFLFPSSSFASFTGPVIYALDGDSLEVLHNHHPKRISGIDCPEKGQAYGNKAKHAASALAFGEDVTVQTHGYDKYGRTLADVLLPDGTNVNHMLVKDGWCWWYRKYAPGDTVFEALEKDAMEAKKGLWPIRIQCPRGSGDGAETKEGDIVSQGLVGKKIPIPSGTREERTSHVRIFMNLLHAVEVSA